MSISLAPDHIPGGQKVSTATGVPHQQAVKVEYAVYILPPVGTQCAMPTMGNIEGPQQVANGSWPSTCPGKVVSPPAKISATTNQTQFIDSTTFFTSRGLLIFHTRHQQPSSPHAEPPSWRAASLSKHVERSGKEWLAVDQL